MLQELDWVVDGNAPLNSPCWPSSAVSAIVRVETDVVKTFDRMHCRYSKGSSPESRWNCGVLGHVRAENRSGESCNHDGMCFVCWCHAEMGLSVVWLR